MDLTLPVHVIQVTFHIDKLSGTVLAIDPPKLDINILLAVFGWRCDRKIWLILPAGPGTSRMRVLSLISVVHAVPEEKIGNHQFAFAFDRLTIERLHIVDLQVLRVFADAVESEFVLK